MYGVIIQPITNDTTPSNVERYGEVINLDRAFDEGFARTFCDGQTSPVPPQYADDQAGMLYTYSEGAAQAFSGQLRRDLAARIASGVVQQSPSWLSSAGAVTIGVLTPTAMAGYIIAVSAIAPEGITAGQMETAIQNAVQAGATTEAEILAWIEENARWIE